MAELNEENDKFKLHLIVDKDPKPANGPFKCTTGYITKQIIKETMPEPGPETMIMFSGPPAFEKLVIGYLKELKYTPDMMFKH